jgi:murein L,D-transpeptidase YcbB/YkuD
MLQIGQLAAVVFLLIAIASCAERKHVGEKELVAAPVDIDAAAAEIIEATLDDLADSAGTKHGLTLFNPAAVKFFYNENGYKPIWSQHGAFGHAADSLFQFIEASRTYGLFPEDYNKTRLDSLRQLVRDTTKEDGLDAAKWAEVDLLLTSAYTNIIKDLKRGRIITDSVLRRDTMLVPKFYYKQWESFGGNIEALAAALEPKQPGYVDLKEALQFFLQKAKFKKHTYINPKDSARLKEAVAKRLSEEDSLTFSNAHTDSLALAVAIKKYQAQNGLKETGKLTGSLVAQLNNTDNYKFARIALNLDRYKSLPPLPQQYIWVNIPSYQLQLWDSGVVVLTSKVVVGKPETRTPQLTSAISDLITYPKWHIPQSIIKKEILPALKRDPGYLSRKGFSLVDGVGNEVDPYGVQWAKYESNIPYTVVQGSGDDNALGVIKFNFPNKYAVYLHDTNQRYLFSREKRALSHGCVRVEAWEELAAYILQRDSASANAVPLDSMLTWLALKEKHLIPVRKKLPLFIRYFTCVPEIGEIVFLDDVYDEDRKLINQFFKHK